MFIKLKQSSIFKSVQVKLSQRDFMSKLNWRKAPYFLVHSYFLTLGSSVFGNIRQADAAR